MRHIDALVEKILDFNNRNDSNDVESSSLDDISNVDKLIRQKHKEALNAFYDPVNGMYMHYKDIFDSETDYDDPSLKEDEIEISEIPDEDGKYIVDIPEYMKRREKIVMTLNISNFASGWNRQPTLIDIESNKTIAHKCIRKSFREMEMIDTAMSFEHVFNVASYTFGDITYVNNFKCIIPVSEIYIVTQFDWIDECEYQTLLPLFKHMPEYIAESIKRGDTKIYVNEERRYQRWLRNTRNKPYKNFLEEVEENVKAGKPRFMSGYEYSSNMNGEFYNMLVNKFGHSCIDALKGAVSSKLYIYNV